MRRALEVVHCAVYPVNERVGFGPPRARIVYVVGLPTQYVLRRLLR